MQLNEQQKEIVENPGGKIAVIAGAGSGKTTTTMELIFKLHTMNEVPLSRMFITTFTNKAGEDLKYKMMKRLQLTREEVDRLWIGTFHSLGYRYLTRIKEFPLTIILPVEANLYLKNIYKEVVKEDNLDDKQILFSEVYKNIEFKRNRDCPWEDLDYDYPEVCKKVFEIYQEEKKDQDIIDFNDILDMFAKEIKEDPLFTSKFDWVFIDECQDLNPKQVELSELLHQKNIVRVGDLKQSLYAFRGAMPQLFKKKIDEADIIYPLAYNYRSSPEIINFANKLLEQLPSFHGQELVPTCESNNKPVFTICENMAAQIYNNIRLDIKKGIPLDQIAVLARSIKPMTIQNLQIFLRRNGVPYVLRGGDDRLNASYIQNYLSVLKGILSPTKVSLVNSFSLLPSVGPKTAKTLADSVLAYGFDYLGTMNAKYAHTTAFKDYLKLTGLVGQNKELLLRTLDFIHDHHLVIKYGRKDRHEPGNKKTIIYDALYNNLIGYKNLMEGIDSLYVNEDDDESGKNKVVISTIHQAKGLEWESVHIGNMNEYAIPYIREDEEGDEERAEEEFCAAYVACTRAKKYLKMYMQFKNGTHAQAQPNRISRYLTEIYKTSKEKFFTFRVLDVYDEQQFKEAIYMKSKGF